MPFRRPAAAAVVAFRLRTLALLQGLLVATVPLTVMVLQVPVAHREALEGLEEDAFADAREAAAVQQRAVRDLTNALAVLVEIPAVVEGVAPHCEQALDSAAGARRDLEAIWRIDGGGSVLCSSRGIAKDLSDWPPWQEFLAVPNRTVASPAADPVTGDLVLPLAARVPGQPGELLIGALGLSRLHARMQTLVAGDAQVFVLDPAGRLVAATAQADVDAQTLGLLPPEGRMRRTTGDDAVLYVSVPLDPEGGGRGRIVVGVPTASLEAEARGALVEALVVVLAAFVLAGAVALGFARLAFGQPVRRVTRWVRHLEQGKLAEPAPRHRLPRELLELTDALEAMAGSIERMETDRKRLLNHVAHQLRTPLTPLFMQVKVAQLALQKGVPETALRALGQMDRPLQDLAAKAEKLDRLGGLLLGTDRAFPEWVDALAVLAAVAHRVEENEGGSPAPVDVQRPDTDQELSVYADERLAAIALGELLQNALAEAGSATVQLRAWRDGQGTMLAVQDPGQGLSHDTLERLEKGQWAWDAPGQRAGLGAGLLIARLVAEAHHGRLHAAPIPEGAVVGLWFPDAPEP